MAILSSDLGLSKAAFRNLLMNRHEIQEGAVLEEAEKKPVDVLRAVYEHWLVRVHYKMVAVVVVVVVVVESEVLPDSGLIQCFDV